ncbi:MAG: O-antigen polymerase [Candidatus Micrarchaeia archaeon]
MEINPDDLLIFKKRGISGSASSSKTNDSSNNVVNGKKQPLESSVVQQKPQPKINTQDINLPAKNLSNTTNISSTSNPSNIANTSSISNKPPIAQEKKSEKTVATTPTSVIPTKSDTSKIQPEATKKDNIKSNHPNQPISLKSGSKPMTNPTIITSKTDTAKTKTDNDALSKKLFERNQAIERKINMEISKEGNALTFENNNSSTDKDLFSEDLLLSPDSTGKTSNKKRPEKNKASNQKEESVDGLACINHPWRSAYAMCSYCHRPFCYADIAKSGGKNYCLEDIDEVSKVQSVLVKKIYIYNYIAGIIFLLSIGILLYYSYPQIHYSFSNMLLSIKNLGILNFIKSININYLFEIRNLLILVFTVIGSLFLFMKSEKATIIATLFLAAITFLVSYTYLSTNVYYFLYLFMVYVLTMVVLAAGKMSNIGSLHLSEVTERIEWPRAETF